MIFGYNGKVKITIFQKVKHNIDACKFGGLIYILLFVIIIWLLRGCFRRCYYNETLLPEQYRTTYVHEKNSIMSGETSSDKYLYIGIEYEVDGITQKEELLYEGAYVDRIYHIAIQETEYEIISEVTEIEQCIGNLHYNRKHPEKMICGSYFGR